MASAGAAASRLPHRITATADRHHPISSIANALTRKREVFVTSELYRGLRAPAAGTAVLYALVQECQPEDVEGSPGRGDDLLPHAQQQPIPKRLLGLGDMRQREPRRELEPLIDPFEAPGRVGASLLDGPYDSPTAAQGGAPRQVSAR